MDGTGDNVNLCFVEFKTDKLSRTNECGILTLILELDISNSFFSISLSVASLI